MGAVEAAVRRVLVRLVPAHDGQEAHEDGRGPGESYDKVARVAAVFDQPLVHIRLYNGHVLLQGQQGEREHGAEHGRDHGRVAHQTQVVVLAYIAGDSVQTGVVRFQCVDGEQVERAGIEEGDAE